MAKTILIGPAGCGKTRRILDEFEKTLKADPDPLSDRCFFLVPSAEHTGRIINVLMARGIDGFFHRRVTTVSRLISATFGIGDEGVATNMTRYVLLRDIFQQKNWEVFKDIQQSAGFLNHMLSFIAELKESMISCEFWREKMNTMKKQEPDLAAKYEALAGIYEAYEAGLSAKGVRDRQDGFRIFQERKEAGLFKNRRFHSMWLDGFFDFSALQLAYFRELCGMTENVTVTMTCEEGPARASLFEGLEPSINALKEMGFKIERIGAENRKRFLSADLGAIERNLFREEKFKPAAPAGDAVIFEAIGIEGEAEMIARQIEKLHRSGDYRFSDFAVLLREIGPYDGVLRSVFARYDIPVELHERERLQFSPLMRVMVRLIKIFRDGWKRSDLMEFLKSTYVTRLGAEAKEYEWISSLEHQAMEKGVFRGREAWLESWGNEALDEVRQRRLGTLAQLEDRMRGARAFAALKGALLDSAARVFGIFQRTDSLEEYVRRDAAGMRRLDSILDETGLSFAKGDEVSFDVFADRFFRLVELDLYPLHEKDRNRVQVYSVSLARQKEYRVVFAAGLLEKKFPVQLKEDPVFSDWERQLFNGDRAENILKEKLPRQSMERYLFYLAATRASEKLFLTYPRLDLEGKETLPSYYVDEIRSVFGGQLQPRRQELGRPYPFMEEAVSARELEMALMGELWEPEKNTEKRPQVLWLTNELLKRPETREKFKRAFYEITDELVHPEIKALDVFKPFDTSPTTLEEYARCPFKYYAHRVLKLDDPEEDVNVTRRGSILHLVLQKCFEKWDGKYPDIERAMKDAERELEAAWKRYPLVTEKKYQTDLERESLKEMLEAFLRHELERLKDSPLQPRYFELPFGKEGSRFPALEIDVNGKKMKIKGEIDRVDTDASGTAAAIIDYKRTASAAKFDKKDFEMGISLQLPLYLAAVERFLKLKPAGAELYAVKERRKSGFYHEDFRQLFPDLTSRKIIMPEKEFQQFLAKCLDFVRGYAAEMADLKMPVRPRSVKECDFCSYGPVCRIQKWRVPLIVEELKEKMEEGKA